MIGSFFTQADFDERARVAVIGADVYKKLFEAPAVYESITADDVRKAAATVMTRENRTVGIVEPKAPDAAVAQGGAR